MRFAVGVRTALGAGLAAACTLGLAACGGSSPQAQQTRPTTTRTASTPAPRPSSAPESAPPTHVVPVRVRRARIRAAVAQLATHEPGHAISVAARDLDTGATFTAGARGGMWTASAYKLLILETLMIQQGGPLSGYEADQAIPMIENSDNEAGYSLFLAAGGCSGLQAAARKLGMTHTVVACNDPTFTTTSAADYLHLVHALVRPSVLTRAAQKYALHLMANVESDQRWGVGVVADRGTQFWNKNGWLSIGDDNDADQDDNGRWAVTSVGIVTVHGDTLLLAAFTQHQPDMGDGVHLTQQLSRLAARAATLRPAS